ncbi:MAG TPA: LD-carboxypeptidase [Bacillota bacterium]
MILYPHRLSTGDTIGVIAPAGPPDEEHLQRALPFFQQMGLHVTLGKHITSVHDYLAGTDEQRLDDVHEMIANPHIKGIFFARGGYGSGRLASALNYQLIKKNPKIMWGYSDLTYLHTAIRQETRLVTFHGPMVASDMGRKEFDRLSLQMFQQLFQPTILHYSEHISPLHVFTEGEARAPIVGGNLSLLASTLQTPFEFDTKHKLLLLEDIDEEPYEVDRLLHQLKLAGKLAHVEGIILGDFKVGSEASSSHLLDEVFYHYFHDLDVPVMAGFKIGHCFPHFAIPLGVEASLSTKKKTLTIQPGVQ